MRAEEPGRSAATELERHPSLDDRFDPAVRIVDYDGASPGLALRELRRIEEALGDVAVRLEHLGSTAVPGLAAKPILDLQLSVDAVEPRERYVVPLERLGYLFVPSPDRPLFGISRVTIPPLGVWWPYWLVMNVGPLGRFDLRAAVSSGSADRFERSEARCALLVTRLGGRV